MRRMSWVVAALLAFAIAGCRADVEDEGRLPDVEVNDPGELPEVDIDPANVEVSTDTQEIRLGDDTMKVLTPDVDIGPPGSDSSR